MDAKLEQKRLLGAPLCEGLFVVLITGLAALLRLIALDKLPPGLYRDEAYNGLDALGVLGGNRPLFFTANNGREPMFVYMLAASVRLWGRTPAALRWLSALVGTFTVPAIYALGGELFDRRVAAIGAILATSTIWTLNLSRVAFRAVTLPPLAALALLFLWRGLRSRRSGQMVWAGLLYGSLFYTYLAARFSVVALFLFIIYGLWRERRDFWLRGWLVFAAVALVVSVPLGLVFAADLTGTLRRAGQVSIWNPAINAGDPWGTLLRHTYHTVCGFVYGGDFIPRHNVPLRPVFGPLVGLAFLGGLGLALIKARRERACALCLIWLGTMLLPTILAEDAPHMLRAAGVLPVLFFFPALGLDQVWRWMDGRGWKTAGALLLVALLLTSAVDDLVDYRWHLRSEAAYYNFEAGASEMAAEINRFLGRGWQGQGLLVDEQDAAPDRQVLLSARLWRDWPSLRYLCPETDGLAVLSEDGDWPEILPPARLMLVLWPFEDHGQALARLPANRLLSVQEGAQERGDLETESRLLYLLVRSEPPDAVPQNAEVFWQQGIQLVGYELAAADDRLQIALYWRCDRLLSRDYAVFCHLLDDGQMIAQHDGPPALGYYATGRWRPGDIIRDVHTIAMDTDAAPTQLAIGLYYGETMEHLELVDADGQPSGQTRLLLDLE